MWGVVVEFQNFAQIPERITFQLREHERRQHRSINPRSIRQINPFAFEHRKIIRNVLPDNHNIRADVRQNFIFLLQNIRHSFQICRANTRESLHHGRNLFGRKELVVRINNFAILDAHARKLDDAVHPGDEPGRLGIQNDEGEGGELHSNTVARFMRFRHGLWLLNLVLHHFFYNRSGAIADDADAISREATLFCERISIEEKLPKSLARFKNSNVCFLRFPKVAMF